MNEKNMKLRDVFNDVMEENGLLLTFASKKMNIVSPTLSRWRYGHFDLGTDKLKAVQQFCSKYQ